MTVSATPILDLDRDPPGIVRSWTPMLFGALLGVAVAQWAQIDPWSLVPALFISVMLHECGHLVAGKLAGMEPGGVVICGVMLLKSGDRWLCRFDGRRLLSGGIAKPLPRKGDFDARRYA